MANRTDSDSRFPIDLQGEPLPEGHAANRTRPYGDMLLVDVRSLGALPVLPEAPAPTATESGRGMEAGQEACEDEGVSSMFWLEGDVLMCACPSCGAPMSVRLWLMMADCWRCETSIELTEEQEREALRLLQRRHARLERQTVAAGVPSSAASGALQAPPRPMGASRDAAPRPAEHHRAPREPLEPPRELAAPPRTADRPWHANRPLADRVHSLLKNMPAWLISLLFHVILITMLGLLTSRRDDGPHITLSSRISRIVREGGDTRIVAPSDNATFDLGTPEGMDLADPDVRRAAVLADQDARELRLVDPDSPFLPELTTVKEQIGSVPSSRTALVARDPRVRVEMVRREGGTTLTEAAVARGLRWLAQHQSRDGSWSLDRFHHTADCDCGDRASLASDSAGTSLALLPFLGAGQTHLTGVYRDDVALGLRWLIQSQKPDGDLRGNSDQYPGMYAQGQAAIVLCEAFLMTGDEQLRVPAQKAIDFIVNAQYSDGGWRYFPGNVSPNLRGDTSVLGWQLMALQSALSAGLSVPDETLENAGRFLDSVQRDGGTTYAYLPHDRASPPMTAEALLCRVYLGWKRNHPALRDGVTRLLKDDPPSDKRPNIYYWYYATQTLHHFGGAPWREWNLHMRDVLVSSQETRGHEAGSWTPVGPLTSQGGRIYMTSLAVCCLEVYYRHLPIFRQVDLE